MNRSILSSGKLALKSRNVSIPQPNAPENQAAIPKKALTHKEPINVPVYFPHILWHDDRNELGVGMSEADGDPRYWLPPVKDGKPQVLTKRRKERGDVVAVAGDKGGREFRSLDAPLEFYVARRYITGRQYRAGKRLATLWAKANPSQYVQVRYEDGDGGAKALSFAPHGFGAVEYREAMRAISSEEARRIVFAVCCEGLHASQAVSSTSGRTARRKGSAMLSEALNELADHFKYD